MRKILFYINTLERGGAERVLCNLANQFIKKGYITFFVTSYWTKDEYQLDENVERYNLDEHNRENFLSKNVIRIKNLKKIIKKVKPDVIISFLPESIFRVILVTMTMHIPIVISVRNDPQKEYACRSYKLLARMLYMKADWIVFQTEEAKKWFSPKIQKKSSIILNQVDEKFFMSKKEDEEYYCALGRLVEQKNYPMMIKVFSKFVSKYPSEKLYIYGEGILKKELQKLIKIQGMENNIFLKGLTSNPQDILARAKGFIITSDYEGMPNTLLEAMAVGIPVIATDCPCGGPKMVIKNDENGILIPVGDEEALFKALVKVENDKIFRKKIGGKARMYANCYRPDIIFEEWEDIVKKVTVQRGK